MARRPKRPLVDCYVSWITRRVRGRKILPAVTRQPLRDYCGAQVALESFESRCRILNAEFDLPFPTLSIQHLVDQHRDAKAMAVTLAEKKEVDDVEYVFTLLENNGVTTKEDYDNAPPAGDGRFTKNVEGPRHYKLTDHEHIYVNDCPLRRDYDAPAKMRQAIDEIDEEGPVYGYLVARPSFGKSAHKINRAPTNKAPDGPRLSMHAVLLVGFGARGRRTGVFSHQNNWGPDYHAHGRGLMETKCVIGVVVPRVIRYWDN